MISRLFPFKRGLCHAYWAPNLWAVYNVVDKMCVVVARWTGTSLVTGDSPGASMTGGLVQDIHHAVLPNISPLTTMILTLVLMTPSLVKLWSCPNNMTQFIRCLALCSWTSFLCGWHVHEKAILLVTLPMTILAGVNKQDARYFLIISTVGHVSLLPLLFTKLEIASKLLLHICYSLLLVKTLQSHAASNNWLEIIYLALSIPVILFGEFVKIASLPFLPLLVYSLYCAVGVIYTYVRVYINYIII